MKILVLADIHGETETLSKFVEMFKEDVDVIVCPGDFTNIYATPPEFDQLDMSEIIVQKILSLRKPALCVPGNHDLYEIVEVLDEYGVNLQAETKKIGNLTFVGWGGALTPFRTNIEPSEEETKEVLEKIGKKAGGDVVLVVHNPPKNTKLDKIKEGNHVGSQAIHDFIVSKKPILCISAHIQEAFGEDMLGNTTLFYPGALSEGRYGIVEINDKTKKIKTQIKEFKVPEKKETIETGALF